MSDLTVVLFTIGLVLLSTGLVMRWQDRQQVDTDTVV